jgi:hypothetical protein
MASQWLLHRSRTDNTHVSTRAVELAIVFHVEVYNVDGTASIVLDNLVGSMVSTATNDPAVGAWLVVLDAKRIFANVFPPYKLQRAVSSAVNTFSLVLTDDHVAQSGAFAEVEYGIFPIYKAVRYEKSRSREMVSLPPSA